MAMVCVILGLGRGGRHSGCFVRRATWEWWTVLVHSIATALYVIYVPGQSTSRLMMWVVTEWRERCKRNRWTAGAAEETPAVLPYCEIQPITVPI